ncbi:MAG: response regulator [Bdellovibrionales bacterium]|nr:response regulator [Bdellovibrionales bacterium]
MKKSDIKILLIEDDNSLGKGISEVLKQVGFDVRWAQNADEALKISRQMDVSLAIIDCLLPKINGIDLAQKLKSQLDSKLKLILMSGIYKDKSFAKEALQKTQAHSFLIKPFDLEQLTSIVLELFSDHLEADLPPLLDSLTVSEVNKSLRLECLKSCQSVHGFDLPLIFSLVFGSDFSGHLLMTDSKGTKSTLIFQSGKLSQVLLKDRTSYFGSLLVEMGFTSPEEVSDVLKDTNNNPIGERLVAAQYLSPHAIQIVREEQMLIRLSKTIQDTFFDLEFLDASEDSISDVVIDHNHFARLLWDWVISKIESRWLASFYNRWLENPILLQSNQKLQKRLQQMVEMKETVQPFMTLLQEGHTLSELLEMKGVEENKLFQILHFLLIEKLAYFGPKKSSQEDKVRKISRLKRMIQDAKDRDFFHTLGVTPKVSDRELNKNYMELAKTYHPDRVESSESEEVKSLFVQYFARITEAYETLKDPEKRKTYTREINEGSAEKIMQRETLFEQGLALLNKGKYQQAYEILNGLAQQRHSRADIYIYLTWALIKSGPGDTKIEKFLTTAGENLNKVPPEERHSAPYFYAKGLFFQQLGDLEKSKTNFKHALAMDANFVEARRDLAVIRDQLKAQGSSDLSTVVTNFFQIKRKAK